MSALEMTRTLEIHAEALAESLERSVVPLIEQQDTQKLQQLVDHFKDKNELAGVQVDDATGAKIAMTSSLNVDQGIPSHGHSRTQQFFRKGQELFHVLTTPLFEGERQLGSLSIFHDATFIDARKRSIWQHTLTAILIQVCLVAAFVPIMFHLGVKRPLRSMAVWMRELRVGTPTKTPDLTGFEAFGREAANLASSLSEARAAAENEARLRDLGESSWTPERLRVFVRSKLGQSRLFVVSNREPYEHWHGSKGIRWTVPASGLVTALEPVLRACDGTWIAQATGDADKETADEFHRVRVPPDHPQYSLKRLWLTDSEEKGFYSGFSNEGLWPLCSMVHTRPIFRMEDWTQYQAVNQRFAETLLDEMVNDTDPVVLVQDYHFALLPKLIKERRPDARVAIFWHIPWPNPEAFGICPWQKNLLDGLLGADLIGFHIQAHCNNFLDTVDRALEARILREKYGVERNGSFTLVRPFPISVADPVEDEIPFPSNALHVDRRKLLDALGLKASMIGVGVDRVDYIKGIPEKFRAVERFLEKYPEYVGEFSLIQIGSPSRTTIPRYQELGKEIEEEEQRINRRFQTLDWRPIVLLRNHHSHSEILPYYRSADFCFVNSLHDGMNLVAKEFVASRADSGGVLILSQFTGAAQDLPDALIVNPYDTEGTADTIKLALEMSSFERRTRMQRMRATVRDRNVYKWAGKLIEALCQIRPETSQQQQARRVGALN